MADGDPVNKVILAHSGASESEDRLNEVLECEWGPELRVLGAPQEGITRLRPSPMVSA